MEEFCYRIIRFFEKTEGDWCESVRKITYEGAVGITRTYEEKENYKYELPKDVLSTSDVIGAYECLGLVCANMKSYYNGITSDGLYEDSMGNAFYVRFFEDGTVKTLYLGKFSEGKFNDDENSSWDISKDVDTDYMFYKGDFKNGKASHNKGSVFTNNLNKQQIEDILEKNLNIKIDIDLKWSFDDEIL